MTEAEWRECKDPAPMLVVLGEKHSFQQDEPTFRKAALFSCACCRRIWSSLSDRRSRDLVEIIEREVDGATDWTAVWNAEDHAKKAADEIGGFASWATWLLAELTSEATPAQVEVIADAAANAHAFASIGGHDTSSVAWVAARKVEKRDQADILRDVFGNTLRPVSLSPSWRTSTVVALAARVYEARDFSAMPILADALQDAGCDCADVLEHCRSEGPHVRGCWVVDLVLGKE